jgi:dihydroorotate dehydrogenase (fumarate)
VLETRTRTGALSRRALAALAFAAVLAALIAAPSAVAYADDTESISGAPCGDDGAADGRSRFTYEAAPGQRVEDCYVVANTGTTVQTVSVYATDAFNTEGGDFALLDASAQPTDAGAWVTLEDGAPRMQFDLAPGQSRPIRFAMTVPPDAGPGDHAGGLLVSAQSPSEQILVDRRVGTRLYVRVPGDLQSLLNITGLSAVYNPSLNPLEGTATTTLTVTNQGNVALAPTLVLAPKSFFGTPLTDPVLQNLDELLPGASRTVTVDLGPIGQFVYVDVSATLSSRGDQTGAASEAASAPQVERSTGVWAVPWILVGALLLAALFVLYARWRRRRDDRRAAEWMAFTQAEAARSAAAGDPSGRGVGVGAGR